MKRVLISVCNEDWLHRYLAATLINMAAEKRYTLEYIFPVRRPYEAGLHHCIVELLKRGCDYWLNIDADNPPIRNPLDLVELDLEIVGLPTPIWKWDGTPGENPIIWNAFMLNGDKQNFIQISECSGLQRVDGIGSGCFLAARRVFKRKALQKGCFQRLYNEDGTVKKGCDIAFSERATAEGVKIHAHFDYPCRHFKNYDLSEIAEATHGYIAKGINDLNSELYREYGKRLYHPTGNVASDLAKAHIAGQKLVRSKR